MKRISLCLVGLMVLSLSSFARGEETDAEKTLKSFGEFMVGGVWKMELDGKKRTSHYSWFGDNKFIRISTTTDGKPDDSLLILGIDPNTEHVSLWGFSEKGVSTSTLTQHDKNVWNVEVTFNNDAGQKNTWKGRFVRIGQDELSIETIEVIEDGTAKKVLPAWVWTRHKS